MCSIFSGRDCGWSCVVSMVRAYPGPDTEPEPGECRGLGHWGSGGEEDRYSGTEGKGNVAYISARSLLYRTRITTSAKLSHSSHVSDSQPWLEAFKCLNPLIHNDMVSCVCIVTASSGKQQDLYRTG